MALGIASILSGCYSGDLPEGTVQPPPVLESFEVTSDGHPLTVWARVPAEPEHVVLLLHGRTWSILPDFDLGTRGEPSLMEFLASEGVAVYGLDARGYGTTPRDESGWLEPDRMALDVRSVLTWLRGRHSEAAAPVVMGWSYGSAIGHLAAQRWPELVSGVSLYGYFKDPATEFPVSASSDEPPRSPTTREGALSDFITPGSIDSTDIERFVQAALESDPVRVDIRNSHQLNAISPDSLGVPTQILQGELDPIAPTQVQARLFQSLGTAHKEWVVLPGCDHAAHLERCKERFESALLRFVEEVG
ncbi:MAG: alpha/beta fold hydrolase [Gemmatimonadetes bacterium]|nr:alpha/beta fold hydrolase [Gemmatimonadota bacterium]